MATLTIAATFDYSASTLINVTGFNFTNTTGTAMATFRASQFDDLHIKSLLSVTGSAGVNHILVSGTQMSGVSWIFTNWSANDRITLSGTTGADTLTGTSRDDLILGGDGNDLLGGGGGQNTLYGGNGDDRLSGSAATVFNGGTGTDKASLTSLMQAISLSIDIQDGGGGRNIGDRTTFTSIEQLWVLLGSGNDTVSGGALSDTVQGSSGNDVLAGRGSNDSLSGGFGNDNLSGGSGNDILRGSFDKDTLAGGTGADRFIWIDDTESGLLLAADVVTDFEQGLDRLDLHKVVQTSAQKHFLFIGPTEFLGESEPELRYYQNNLATIVLADTDGDGVANFEIRLNGLYSLTLNDFIL